eukprot:1195217-Prorocentrum_minimum.AAC.2
MSAGRRGSRGRFEGVPRKGVQGFAWLEEVGVKRNKYAHRAELSKLTVEKSQGSTDLGLTDWAFHYRSDPATYCDDVASCRRLIVTYSMRRAVVA